MDDRQFPQPVSEGAHTAKEIRRKVAVLAVHGVAKHAAGDTQSAMADLLLALPIRKYHDDRIYEPFRSVGLQIPLQPVLTGRPVAKAPPKTLFDVYDERSAEFARHIDKTSPSVSSVGQVSTEYTDLLLDKYEGGADGNAYITSRLEGSRKDGGPEVHIYEVLWSDLAKPKSSILSFFLALFQVLLHLASLSRTAIDTGAAETSGAVWKTYRHVQRYAVRILQIFIPLLEIMLFIGITSCFSAIAEPTRGRPAVAVLLGGLGLTAITFFAVNKGRWSVRIGPWFWVALALVPGAAGSGLAWYFASKLGADLVTAALWWLIPGAGFLIWILKTYGEIRAGVKVTGWIIYGLSFAFFGFFLYKAADHSVVQAAFWVAAFLLAAVRFCWALLIGLAFVALILGSCAWRWAWPKKSDDLSHSERKARARAAVRTSRLALALPSVMFLLITLMIWNGFTKLAAKEIKDPLFEPGVTSQPLPGPLQKVVDTLHLLPVEGLAKPEPGSSKGGDNYIGNMLAWSVGYQLPVTLALLGLSCFLLVWWSLPSVLTERFPLRNEKGPPRSAPDDVSVHMGSWLSRGLDATAAVTLLMWSAIFLAPVVYFLLDYFASADHGTVRYVLNSLKGGTKLLVVAYGFIGTAILAGLAKGGQEVLGIVLDVDTYLRSTPPKATPRAKIFERYISTLRYLNDPAQGYDSIVIAAHSLGALISGDLLHYVHAKDLEDFTVPTQLLTMGNPTRQLLNRFFPYLYDWVQAVPDNSLHPLPPPLKVEERPDHIDSAARPHTNELNLTHWVSAYRSGDYVGRSLWLKEWFWRTQAGGSEGLESLLIVSSHDGRKVEVCIGAGAHTHYMDDTAPEITWILDSLIVHGNVSNPT